MSTGRELTDLEVTLVEWILKVETALREQRSCLADPLRLGLYWRLIEAQARGVNIEPLVVLMKETLKETL